MFQILEKKTVQFKFKHMYQTIVTDSSFALQPLTLQDIFHLGDDLVMIMYEIKSTIFVVPITSLGALVYSCKMLFYHSKHVDNISNM